MSQELELKVAQSEHPRLSLAQPVEGIQEKLENGAVFRPLRQKAVNKLGGVEGTGGAPEVLSQGQEAVNGLTLGYDVQVLPPCQHQEAMGERLNMPPELALGSAGSPGYGSYFAQVGSEEGEDFIGFAQPQAAQDNGFSLINPGCGHKTLLL